MACSHKLIRSKGIHVIVGPMTRGHALTVATRRAFLRFCHGAGIRSYGTTDSVFDGNPDAFMLAPRDRGLPRLFNEGLPGANLKTQDVIYAMPACGRRR